MDSLFDTFEVDAVVHEVRETDRDGRKPDEAVQYRDKFRHLRHLHAPREQQADAAADQERDYQNNVIAGDDTEYRGDECDRHAGDAIPVSAASGFLVRQPAQRKDEKNRRSDVRHSNDACSHLLVLTF